MLRIRSRRRTRITLLGILTVLLAGTLDAQDATRFCAVNGEGPDAGSDGYYEHKNVFWGDLHTHTAWSFDAVTIGTRTTPDDAYKFAKGSKIGLPPYDMVNGVVTATRETALSRPLDFLAVTDHSEYFGETRMCAPCLPDGGTCVYGAPPAYEDSVLCKALQSSIPDPAEDPSEPSSAGSTSEVTATLENAGFMLWGINTLGPNPTRFPFCEEPCQPNPDTWGPVCGPPTSDVWAEYVQAAEDNYAPCTFTTFVAYEWSAMPQGKNHHRNVIFANANVPERPFSLFETGGAIPQNLWKRLDEDCVNSADLNGGSGPDCDAIAIPHNSNIGGDDILPVTNPGTPERSLQITYEPLIEIHQTKGNSECRWGVGNTDEDCQFELKTKKLLFGPAAYAGPLSTEGTMLSADQQGYVASDGTGGTDDTGGTYNNFVRELLKAGLYLGGQSSGSNPYKLGVVGATDTHNSTPGNVDEDVEYPGQHGLEDATSELRLSIEPPDPSHSFLEANPGALTAVWATENSRAAIFSSLKTKETYATSGIRPEVRFFGGWAYDQQTMCDPSNSFEQEGYDRGVPMGSNLASRPHGSTAGPRFAIKVVKDPDVHMDTKIERVQVVKGWIDDQENTQEKVVAVMGPTSPPTHSDYVDTTTCTPRPGGGQDNVCLVWEDDTFQEDQAAFYYVRVLQTPTCRWSTLQCNEFPDNPENPDDLSKSECLQWIGEPAEQKDANGVTVSGVVVEKTIQERAWTSPIWYDLPSTTQP